MCDFDINTQKYAVLEVTRPEKDRFSIEEQVFKAFPYPVLNILEFENERK